MSTPPVNPGDASRDFNFNERLKAWWKKEWSDTLFFEKYKKSYKLYRGVDLKAKNKTSGLIDGRFWYFSEQERERAVMSWLLLITVVPLAGSFAYFLINQEAYQPRQLSVDKTPRQSDDDDCSSKVFNEYQDDGSQYSSGSSVFDELPHAVDRDSFKSLTFFEESSATDDYDVVEQHCNAQSLNNPGPGYSVLPTDEKKTNDDLLKQKITKNMTVSGVLAVASFALLAVGVIGLASFCTGGIGGVLVIGAIAHVLSAMPAVPVITKGSVFSAVGLFGGFGVFGEGCGVVGNYKLFETFRSAEETRKAIRQA